VAAEEYGGCNGDRRIRGDQEAEGEGGGRGQRSPREAEAEEEDLTGQVAEPPRRSGPLRVAVLAPIAWRVPPRSYGPWEQFASLLTEGLVARGVDVTLFATADSITRAHLVGTAPTGYAEDPGLDAKVWEALHIATVFERAGEFDLIHNSFDFLPLSYSRLVGTPVVTTIHGFSSERIVPVYERYNDVGHYVAISDADRHASLDYAATIHHGIAMEEFELGAGEGGYLLFFGRIHRDKGTAEAIDVAARVGLPLIIAGIVQDVEYYERFVAPRVDGERVRYVGAVGCDRRSELLGGALALLHLVDFDEPFGFSVVEAMACGTPVIATARGSMPEIVRHGENGFLVASPEEAVAAVEASGSLDRRGVRRSVEQRFRAGRMVDDYLRLYHEVVASRRTSAAGQSAARAQAAAGAASTTSSSSPSRAVARQTELSAAP
jgi:glycosyltransferase involved in cell wall biosynthesis